MFTENGLTVDLDAVDDLLRRADVLTIGFTTFAERLLIDVRDDGQTGPLVAIVEPVATVQERYHWLGARRGMFGAPEGFSFFVWPHTVRGLVERDVLAPMRARLGSHGRALDETLERVMRLERQAMRDAVSGEDTFQTLWQRAG